MSVQKIAVALNDMINPAECLQQIVSAYTEYKTIALSGCAATQNQYLQAENQASQRRLGFWSQSNPVMTWDFRQGRKP